MKDRSELVRGWIRKAESDLTAMEASAGAGATDAACFHAQQAAEKFLKAFLADREREIPATHNLFKLIGLCTGVDPSFSTLGDLAELLTPFAVEVRYDMDFWPADDTVDQAREAAQRIKEFVSSRLQTGPSRGIPSVPLDSPVGWTLARRSFDWTVDLRRFKPKLPLQGFFDREITPENLREFEESFRLSIGRPGQAARAAEVVFWKSYRQYLNRTRMTEDILDWLRSERDWQRFCEALHQVQNNPNWKNFKVLRGSCGQTSAFAVPLAFLAFSDPTRFPLADRHVADWWSENQPGKSQFEREA